MSGDSDRSGAAGNPDGIARSNEFEIPGPESGPPVRRATPRVYTGELLSTTAALALIPLMLLFDWYGQIEARPGTNATRLTVRTGWSALGVLRWVPALTILLALGATVIHASQRGHGARTDTGAAVLSAGVLASVLIGYRVLISPPNPAAIIDLKLGAPLGLLALMAIALGGWRSLREERGLGRAFTRSSRRSRELASRRAAD